MQGGGGFLAGEERDEGQLRTFGDFDSFDGLVVYGPGALLDELVALDAEIEYICTLHGQLNKPFHRDIDDVGRSLRRHVPQEDKKKKEWGIANDKTLGPCI